MFSGSNQTNFKHFHREKNQFFLKNKTFKNCSSGAKYPSKALQQGPNLLDELLAGLLVKRHPNNERESLQQSECPYRQGLDKQQEIEDRQWQGSQSPSEPSLLCGKLEEHPSISGQGAGLRQVRSSAVQGLVQQHQTHHGLAGHQDQAVLSIPEGGTPEIQLPHSGEYQFSFYHLEINSF